MIHKRRHSVFSLQAARVKGCESLKEWIDDIVNHFWFSYQTCDGSADEMKVRE